LVEKVVEYAGKSRADRIVDLGGGIGFVLSQIRERQQQSGTIYINLDDSPNQLQAAHPTGFRSIRHALDTFRRGDLGPETACTCYLMRSVLHYFREHGLRPVLRHLHNQTRPGECFIHQTAAFHDPQDARCLNTLYRMMRTDKWYPCVADLSQALEDTSWQVLEILPAPPLPLTRADLQNRYQLDAEDLDAIQERLSGMPVDETVFRTTPEGFCAYLHYAIYVCTPAGSTP